MPSWGMHLEISNLLSNKIKNINKNQFTIGNILPDINNGYIIKDISKKIEYRVTHYEENKDFKNYERFYFKYEQYISNSVILGYLTHLLTDYYFNDLTYSRKGIYNNLGDLIGIKLNSGRKEICEKEIMRQMKTGDFKIFANYIYKNEKIEKLDYDESILLVNNIIEEINITKKDLQKTIKYLNSYIEQREEILKENDCKEYRIFTQEEMIKHSRLCVEFIVKYLDIN